MECSRDAFVDLVVVSSTLLDELDISVLSLFDASSSSLVGTVVCRPLGSVGESWFVGKGFVTWPYTARAWGEENTQFRKLHAQIISIQFLQY